MTNGRTTKGAGLAAFLLGLVAAMALSAPAGATGKVDVCHLADGPAQAGIITVSKAAAYHGHYLQHSADIIEPFSYQGTTYSLNWTGSFPAICTGEDPPDEDPIEVEAGVHFQDPTCDTEAAVHVEEREGVSYGMVGDVAPGGTVIVTATAEEGYTLVGQSEWIHTFADAPTGCDDDPPPPFCKKHPNADRCKDDPDPVCVGGCSPDDPDGELPYTGAHWWEDPTTQGLSLGGLAALLLASGGLLLRRKQNL